MIDILPKIRLFFFILGLIYCVKYIIQFILVIKQDNPTPMKIPTINQILLYTAISYVFTYIISLIIG